MMVTPSATLDQTSLFHGEDLRPDWPFGGLEPMGFDLIMADPPWRFELWSGRGEDKSAQAHYQTMTIDRIAALPVGELAKLDSVLWLWATWPLLLACDDAPLGRLSARSPAGDVMAAWGFRYVTGGVWGKQTATGRIAFGTGYRLRCASEPFLIGVKGNPQTAKDVRNLVMGQVREHSRKPDAAYEAAERLMPGARRLDLFSRQSRPGWAAWGLEVGKFDTKPKKERDA